ncbi:MAG TPA: 50S ribosomal protein L25 [Candidatus Limnocylindria bacterium]|nr:50S ribosomal protein L25 [Candidatus Limnocylindria bacterium]
MELELALDAREAQGKANKRLRREGFVPGVVFGKGEGSTSVQLDAKTFETLYRAAGRTSIVKLTLPGERAAKSAFIKSVQRHPVSGQALHVDFYVVNLTQEMESEIPLVFVGEAPAVEETGGTLLTSLNAIRVKALPSDIPHQVDVNVATLVSLDVAIHVRDLSLNRDAVTVLTDADELVAKVMPPRIEEEPEVEAVAEGEEGAEGEAAEGGEGGEAATTEGEAAAEESGEES